MSVHTDIRSFPPMSTLGDCDSVIVQSQAQRTVGVTSDPTSLTTKKDNFNRGTIDFQFEVQGQQRYNPAQSYLVSNVELWVREPDVSNNLRPPNQGDLVAFAPDFMNSMVQSASFYIGGVCVSSVNDYVGLCSMIKYRTEYRKNWFDSLADAFYIIPEFGVRQAQISSNGGTDSIPWSQLGYSPNATVSSDGANPTMLTFADGVGTLPDIADVWGQFPNRTLVSFDAALNRIVGGIDPAQNFQGTTTLTMDAQYGAQNTPVNVVTANLQRIRDTNIKNTEVDRKHKIQILWVPPLGVMTCDQSLCASEFRLKIVPKNDKFGAIQTIGKTNTPREYVVLVNDTVMYNKIYRSDELFKDGDYALVLYEYEAQNKVLVTKRGQTSHNFTLPSSVVELSICFQSTDAGSSDNTEVPVTVFKNRNLSSTSLRHKIVTFAGITKPSTNYDSKWTGDTNNAVQRYYDHIQNISLDQYDAESFEQWLEFGPIYTTKMIRPEGDTSTSCQILVDFEDMTDEEPTEMFIVSKYRRLVKIKTQSGFAVGVTVVDD